MEHLMEWDKHKVAAIATMVLLLGYVGVNAMISAIDDSAWEVAYDGMTNAELQTLNKLWNRYDTLLAKGAPFYNAFNDMLVWIWLILLGLTITSGLTAFTIPKRYTKQSSLTCPICGSVLAKKVTSNIPLQVMLSCPNKECIVHKVKNNGD